MATRSPNTDEWIPDVVYAFGESLPYATKFAAACGAALGELKIRTFPDGETLVTAVPHERTNGAVAALYQLLHQPDDKVLKTAFAASAMREAGARRVILVAPYMPYMRQDISFNPGEAISQAVIGDVFGRAFDGIVTVQPHLHRSHNIAAVFGGTPALALSAGSVIAHDLQKTVSSAAVIVGPDEESTPLIREIVTTLGTSWFVARKVRDGDHAVRFTLPDAIEITERPIVIIDDIISSGSTIATLARALRNTGAASITVYAVHALYDKAAASLMREAGVERVISLDGIPHQSNGISMSDVIARGIGVRH